MSSFHQIYFEKNLQWLKLKNVKRLFLVDKTKLKKIIIIVIKNREKCKSKKHSILSNFY